MENLLENCNSCGMPVNGNFCSECGQKNSKELITLMSLMKLKVLHSIQKKDFSILLKYHSKSGKTARNF